MFINWCLVKMKINNCVFEGGSELLGPWVCLFSQPHRERIAMGSLNEAGFDVYLPFCRKYVLRSRKRVTMSVPLFPRYLFARARAGGPRITTCHRMRGVSGFANRKLEQSLLSETIIAAIRERHDEDGDVILDFSRFTPGQLVKIIDGPFTALHAVFDEPDDRKRSFILLDLLGKTHRVKMFNNSFEVAA